MHFHLLPLEEVQAALRSGPQGLSAEEAARRRAEFGPNTVARVGRVPLAWRLVREFTHFFALILWVAAGLCFLAEWRDPGSGMARLGTAILVVILVNGLFAFWQEARAEQAVRGLEHLLPQEVLVVREGRLVREPAADLVPGDLLVLEDGDVVPADVRLLEGFGLMVDASVLTGESVALPREAGEETEPSPLRARNVLLAGTALVSGQGRGLVYATGMRTEFGHIAGLTQAVKEGRGTLQLEIARVSRTIALLALALGGLFFLLGRQLGLTFWQNLVFAVGIIVANVPEGLLPTVTLALAMASQRMARRNALVRNLPTVETLGAATVICTDKTGTLTQNRMEVRLLHAGGRLLEPGAPEVPRTLLEGARRCQTLRGEPGAWHGDPMEVALRDLGVRALGEPEPWPQVDEIPFDSDRRRLSLLLRGPEGLVLHTKGALQSLLPRCTHLEGPGGLRPLEAVEAAALRAVESDLAGRGLRVLAFAHRAVPEGTPREALEAGLTFAGLVALEDPPRPEVPGALATCRAAGIRVFMVTGDHPLTALAIARQIGLVTQPDAQAPFQVMTGDDLRRMTDAHLQLLLDAPELVFARLDADQKHRIVVALQRKGEVVAVTGDGVNDAPALKAADIGVAMGRSGTEVAREAADLVLTDDNFASIVAAVEEGRAIYANIRRFLTYHMTSNCGELMPYLAFVLFQVPLPLTILQILIIDLGTDMLPALALGAEAPAADTMRRPPRPRGERLLNREVFARAYGVLGLVEGAAGLAAYAVVLHLGGWRWGAPLGAGEPLYLQATTACLSGIIVLQMGAVFLCRHESRSLFRQGLLGNPLLLLGVGFEALVLLGLHRFGPLREVLGTAPVPFAAWAVLLPFLLLMLGLEEARKAWVRGREGL